MNLHEKLAKNLKINIFKTILINSCIKYTICLKIYLSTSEKYSSLTRKSIKSLNKCLKYGIIKLTKKGNEL